MAAIVPPAIGSPLVNVTAGSIIFGDSNGNFAQSNGTLFFNTTNNGIGINTNVFGTNHKLVVNPYVTVDNNTAVQITATANNLKALTVQAFTGASVYQNILEVQTSAGVVVASMTAAGYVGIGTGTPGTWGAFAVRTSITTNTKNVSASYSDGANSTFDIRHLTGSVVDLSAENSNLTFSTATSGTDGVERMRITTAGSVLIGTGALATTATDGFLYIDSGAGIPTGVPTAQTGRIPIYYDSTNNNLYIYNTGWKKTTVFA
ncbi:MAG: hypothetical protein NVS1B10_08090 [Candidatus Saccharimonadales bacterium]